MPYVYDMIVYLKYIALMVEILLLVKSYKSFENERTIISYTELILFVFVIYEFFITIWKRSTSITNISSYIVGILLAIFVLNRNIKQDFEKAMHTISLYFCIAIVLNFLSVFLLPDGLYTSVTSLGENYTNYFLGLDNAFGMVLFPGLTFICFTDEMFNESKPIISVSMLIMTLLTYLKMMSAAGLSATIVLVILYLLYKINFARRLLSLKLLLPINFVLSIGLIMGNAFLYGNTVLANYITSVLGKDITFSSRTLIWNAGMLQFLKQPFSGYGKWASDNIVYIWGAYRIPHNFWLQLLLEGGIVGFSIFVIFMYSAIAEKDRGCYICKTLRIFDIGIFATFIYLLMESGSSTIPVIMLFVTMTAVSREILYNSCDER